MLSLKTPVFPASFLRTVVSLKDKLIQAAAAAVAQFQTILQSRIQSVDSLTPSSFLDLEQEIHRLVARECIDPVVGALIQVAHNFADVKEKALKVMSAIPDLRLQVSAQSVNITLLGGSKVTVLTPYYLRRPPQGKGRPRAKGKRGPSGKGIYPFLAALGIHYRVSPALGSEVARSVALGTIEQSQLALSLRGIRLDRKVIRRLTLRLAERGLAYREWACEQVAKGFRGTSCKDKRIVIAADGGRLKTRVLRRGRRRKSGHHTFDGAWREPKVYVIYEIDENGKKVRRGLLRYDATMQTADGLFQLLKATLQEIGAHEANEWVIVADGADWIWNRVKDLITALAYDSSKVTEIVDLYHAVQHLHKISSEITTWSDATRKAWVKKMRRHLLNGRHEVVVLAIEELCSLPENKELRKLLPYIADHAGRMRYSEFKKRNIPIGSGAVESCVRRIVNLRLKGNGIFWKLETAEGILHLRAQMLSGRWDAFVKAILEPRQIWCLQGGLKATA